MITNKQRQILLEAVRSGNYYLWLSPWNNKRGQVITVWPTNKLLNNKNKKVKPIATHYQARTPMDPPPKLKNSGGAYKSGRFLVMNNSMSNLLLNNS